MTQPIAINVGAILTKAALAIRLGRSIGWVSCVSKKGRVSGKTDLGFETWEAGYYRGGRLSGYTLLTLQDPADETKGAQICAG
jgi:hypothetical protein